MFFARFLYKLTEHYYDWRWGVHTYAYASAAELGFGQDCKEYAAVPYRDLFCILRALPEDVRGGTLVDFGSGMGRVIIAAHRMGFKNPVGVELSGVLCEQARKNIAGLPITVLQQDGTQFAVPPDATVFFFALPFTGEPLRKVLNNIEESVRRHPRPCILAAYMVQPFEREALTRAGIVRERLGSCSYPKAGWAIYRVRAEEGATSAAASAV